jgi:hypothetical protein
MGQRLVKTAEDDEKFEWKWDEYFDALPNEGQWSINVQQIKTHIVKGTSDASLSMHVFHRELWLDSFRLKPRSFWLKCLFFSLRTFVLSLALAHIDLPDEADTAQRNR